MYRVTEHPILEIQEKESITFYFGGKPMEAKEGDTIAAALTANGIRVYRETQKRHEPRGLFCAIGNCTDCVMVVDGKPNVRTCITLVKEGMQVEKQIGTGRTQP